MYPFHHRLCGLYESKERLLQRERVLERLHYVLHEYYALHERETETKQLQLRTFGSYRLGVQSREADIDTYVARATRYG